jgi:hypothetical protein
MPRDALLEERLEECLILKPNNAQPFILFCLAYPNFTRRILFSFRSQIYKFP